MALNKLIKKQSQPQQQTAPVQRSFSKFGKKSESKEHGHPVKTEEKKEYPKVNENQILRIDGKNCFLEVTKGGFNLKKSNDIGKVHLSINKYDGQTHKMTDTIDLFVDFLHWLSLTDLFDTGEYLDMMEETRNLQLKGKYEYASPFWIDNGRWSNPQGKIFARMLKLSVGNKKDQNGKFLPIHQQPIIVKGEITPGKESATGLVMPIPGARPEQWVQVPVPQSDFKAMLRLVNMQIQAYYSAAASRNVLKDALTKIYDETCQNNKVLLELKNFVDVED